jgi:hypothetical protein
MKPLLPILLASLLAISASAGTGHRVLLGRGTVGSPVYVRLAVVPAPFPGGILNFKLPPLNTAYSWTLESSPDLKTWTTKPYTNKFGR